MKPVQIEFLKAQLMHLLATRPPATLHQRVHRARIYLLRARREASVLIEQSQLLITEARRRG